MEFGVIPVLEMNGIQLHQSNVIAKYLGVKHGLAPDDAFARARIEAVVEMFRDAEMSLSRCYKDR